MKTHLLGVVVKISIVLMHYIVAIFWLIWWVEWCKQNIFVLKERWADNKKPGINMHILMITWTKRRNSLHYKIPVPYHLVGRGKVEDWINKMNWFMHIGPPFPLYMSTPAHLCWWMRFFSFYSIEPRRSKTWKFHRMKKKRIITSCVPKLLPSQI